MICKPMNVNDKGIGSGTGSESLVSGSIVLGVQKHAICEVNSYIPIYVRVRFRGYMVSLPNNPLSGYLTR